MIHPWILKKTVREGDCLVFTGSRNKAGYGVTQFQNYKSVAHRIAYALTNGPIPKGLLVCHKCDNPPCINPEHLFLGTHKDNALDMHAKGRGRRGKRNGKAMKLADELLAALNALRLAVLEGDKAEQMAAIEKAEELIEKCTY